MKYSWKDGENNTSYFYREEDGLIVGQAHNVVHTKIWLAKTVGRELNSEKYLGQYISQESSKRAVEEFVLISDRTLLN